MYLKLRKRKLFLIYFGFRDKSSVGMQTMVSAFWRLVRYHLGTAAFGSFIIAMIQLIRIILAYVQHLVERYEARISKIVG